MVAVINVDTLQNSHTGNYPVGRLGYLAEFGDKYWSCYGERADRLEAYTHWCALPAMPTEFTSQFDTE